MEMLKQDINLYLGVTLEDKEIWSWRSLKLLAIGMLLACLLISALMGLRCFVQRSQVFYYQEQFEILKGKLSSYANTLPDFVVRNPQVNNLDEVYKSRPMTTIEAWRTPYLFSHLFVLISQLIPDTVWLRQIELQKQGSTILLEGFSSNEQDLQVFIHQLSRLKTLLPLQLISNRVERIRDDKNKREAYQFYIEVSDAKTNAATT